MFENLSFEFVVCPNRECGAEFPVGLALYSEELKKHQQAFEDGKDEVEVERTCPICGNRSTFRVPRIRSVEEIRSKVADALWREVDRSVSVTEPRPSVESSYTSFSAPSVSIGTRSLREESAELYHEAKALRERGKIEEACEGFRRSAELDRQANNPRGEALALLELARTLIESGARSDEAIEALNRALAPLKERGGRRYDEAMELLEAAGHSATI